jgi:uncharacterized protein involved in propanediol utilization
MKINDKVLFSGSIYTILFDYKNGKYEIRSEQPPLKVVLVREEEMTLITSFPQLKNVNLP